MQYRIGTAGFVGPDDAEIFAQCQTGVQARALQWRYRPVGCSARSCTRAASGSASTTDETPAAGASDRAWARQMAAAAP